jgi:hypothetical protein
MAYHVVLDLREIFVAGGVFLFESERDGAVGLHRDAGWSRADRLDQVLGACCTGQQRQRQTEPRETEHLRVGMWDPKLPVGR